MEYTENAIVCGINECQPQIINALYSDREKIVEEMKKDGYFVKDTSQMTINLSEICQLCDRKGVPSIIQKNTDSSYYKGYGQNRTKKKVEGKKPYWLKYAHREKPKTCWVQQWQGSIEGTFKVKTKTEQVDFRKYFISTAIKKAKEIS